MEGLIGTIAVIFVGALLVLALLFGIPAGCSHVRDYQRTQARKDAINRVKINATKIKFYQQQEGIEKKKADIRVIHAVGIRKAQDEIQATLTPLYVQFEMVQALRDIAASGKNNSVVFVPTSGSGGLPIIPGLTEKAGR